MARFDPSRLLPTLTRDVLNHPSDLAVRLAEREGVARSTVQRALQHLAAAGWLQRGGPRRPWQPGPLRQAAAHYAIAGPASLDEHRAWRRDFAPCFELPPNVRLIAEHAFTELLNNAVDHSGGSRVSVSMRCDGRRLHLLVSDDGCGVFDRVGGAFGIDDPQDAMLELAKGKLTTDGIRHTGRGLFVTSRLADIFDLHANGRVHQYRDWARRDWLRSHPLARSGTSVFMSVALDTPRTLEAVLAEHAQGGRAFDFARTVVPLRLLGDETQRLLSRSQGRRVVSRLAEFAIAELDFAGIEGIGQGFADEVFRVFAAAQPAVALRPLNMSPQVAAMVASVQPAAAAAAVPA